MTDQDHIEITLRDYEDLVKDSKLLQALIRAGVDNWDGYEEALNIFNED